MAGDRCMATRSPGAATTRGRAGKGSKPLPAHYGTMTSAQIKTVYRTLAGLIDPKTELVYHSTYQLLVAVVLSAQATDRSVNAATRYLFAEAATPAAMVALGVVGIEAHLRGINYFHTKARNVCELSRLLIARH
jgi:endonuclease-3